MMVSGVGSMELGSIWMVVLFTTSFLGVFVTVKWLLMNINQWLYERPLGEKRFSLPPGDLGLPFIGNMWFFLKTHKSAKPESFIDFFVSRFGKIGIYKAFMFGSPSIICTVPETCKRVLTDDDAFKPGWPLATVELIGRKSFVAISFEEHKRLRKLTAAPVNGHEALSLYIPYIEEIVISSLEKLATMGQIEF
ncbi:hypothetical protein M0R45_035286 [Rubus argutus]|uniref:Cytochrome P450 n=1 Tax=Rubus argutus TaxID=59490 RepID=A0AAW1VU67_RUBAR